MYSFLQHWSKGPQLLLQTSRMNVNANENGSVKAFPPRLPTPCLPPPLGTLALALSLCTCVWCVWAKLFEHDLGLCVCVSRHTGRSGLTACPPQAFHWKIHLNVPQLLSYSQPWLILIWPTTQTTTLTMKTQTCIWSHKQNILNNNFDQTCFIRVNFALQLQMQLPVVCNADWGGFSPY